MKLLRDLSAVPSELRGGAVAIGNFDGVHRGHARIVERLLERARAVGGRAVVFTFDPHPVRLLRPHAAPPPLTWTDRKAELLSALGVDAVIAYPTDEALLRLSPEEFFKHILCETLQARALVEGPNFFFGHGRRGNVELLGQLANEAGMTLDVVPPLLVDGEYVSSSRVRALLAEGEVRQAESLLTKPYRIRGLVTHGAGRGAKIGFPTANLEGVDTLLPGPGVYAGLGWTAAGRFAAAINIGANPTFGDTSAKLEAHLIGCKANLYGRVIEIDFFSRLRETRPFADVGQLQAQLRIDIDQAAAAAAAHSEGHRP